MIAFGCNRRCNAFQLQNSISFLSCGVSHRVNEYLASIALTSSRRTAMRAMDCLARIAERNLKKKMAKEYTVRPFLCIDNLDFEARVHHKRVENSTRPFHGTWGYVHIPEDSLVMDLKAELDQSKNSNNPLVQHPFPADDSCPCDDNTSLPGSETFDSKKKTVLDLYLNSMKDHMADDVDLKDFLPSSDEAEHWIATCKSQMATVLIEYLIPRTTSTHTHNIPKLMTKPPTVDQIVPHVAEIVMLKLMDVPENSAESITQLMEMIARQIGLEDKPEWLEWMCIEGDIATCRNIEGLRRKLFPAGHKDESLESIMTIPGAAHTLWNMSQSILLHHWGNPDNAKNSGAWRLWEALGGKSQQPLSKKDFNSMLSIIHKVHSASLAYILKETIKKRASPVDLTKTGDAQSIIDECFENYFTTRALNEAQQNGNTSGYNLRLRLRDFATVTEADSAMRQGDIGRVIYMWKRWSLMAQGLKGLSHYALHLPRLVLLFEKGLHPSLAHLLKHSLLIAASGRPGHFVAKDFFLEIQNYWLKFFYNQSVGYFCFGETKRCNA